jgi:hypothetical protein
MARVNPTLYLFPPPSLQGSTADSSSKPHTLPVPPSLPCRAPRQIARESPTLYLLAAAAARPHPPALGRSSSYVVLIISINVIGVVIHHITIVVVIGVVMLSLYCIFQQKTMPTSSLQRHTLQVGYLRPPAHPVQTPTARSSVVPHATC